MTEKTLTEPAIASGVNSHVAEWPGCPGCSAIENDSQCRTLLDGVIVCSTCPDAAIEDEARALMAKPLTARRQALQAMEVDRHGIERANTLRKVLVQLVVAGVVR